MFGRIGKARRDELLAQIEHLATELAAMRGERSTLELERRLESIADERRRALDQLATVQAERERVELEVEHKLGLHRQQIESERRIMVAEAEAERARAVEQARLAVREENLDAERKRFEEEVEFRTKRFEEEAKTLRDLTGQILERLPNITATYTHTVEHAPRELPPASDGET